MVSVTSSVPYDRIVRLTSYPWICSDACAAARPVSASRASGTDSAARTRSRSRTDRCYAPYCANGPNVRNHDDRPAAGGGGANADERRQDRGGVRRAESGDLRLPVGEGPRALRSPVHPVPPVLARAGGHGG